MTVILVDVTITVEGGHKWTVILVDFTVTVEGIINGLILIDFTVTVEVVINVQLFWLTLP